MGPVENAKDADHYLDREERYWKQLGRLLTSSDRVLPSYLDAGLVTRVRAETRQRRSL
jgi:hypothetical protein